MTEPEGKTDQARRRRAISDSVTAAATDAFSDSASGDIGIDTVRSQASPTSRDTRTRV